MLQSSLQGSAYVVMDLAFRLLTNGSRVKRCTFLSSFWFQFVDNEGDEIKENQPKLLGSNMKHVHWLIHWANLHAARIFCYRVSQVVNISIVSLMYLLKSSSCCLILPWCLNRYWCKMVGESNRHRGVHGLHFSLTKSLTHTVPWGEISTTTITFIIGK